MKLSTDYEAEQRELTEQVKTWREVVEIFEQDRSDFDSFAAIVRKYVGIRELTPTIVNEFVKKIIVHAPDKSSGHRRQKIELVWNFIGAVSYTHLLYTPACPKRIRWTARATALPIRRKSCSNTQRTIIFPIPHFSLMTVFPVSLSIGPVGMR